MRTKLFHTQHVTAILFVYFLPRSDKFPWRTAPVITSYFYFRQIAGPLSLVWKLTRAPHHIPTSRRPFSRTTANCDKNRIVLKSAHTRRPFRTMIINFHQIPVAHRTGEHKTLISAKIAMAGVRPWGARKCSPGRARAWAASSHVPGIRRAPMVPIRTPVRVVFTCRRRYLFLEPPKSC